METVMKYAQDREIYYKRNIGFLQNCYGIVNYMKYFTELKIILKCEEMENKAVNMCIK